MSQLEERTSFLDYIWRLKEHILVENNQMLRPSAHWPLDDNASDDTRRSMGKWERR